jgi:hypothetical protein
MRNMLDGLAIPGTTQTLEAFITPPTVTDLDNPVALIWGARLAGSRQTAPRGPGYKKLAWTVDVYLAYLTNPQSPTVDVEFPSIIDAVMAKTWTTTMPLWIDASGVPTAEGTANSSQIQSIGESWELEYPPERTPATMRMLYFGARVGFDVLEVVQA